MALTLGSIARRGGRLGMEVLGLLLRGPAEDSVDPQPHPQASQTEQELQRELASLQGQCQAQALAGAELRTRLESLQGEVSANWGWGSVKQERLAWGLSGPSLALPLLALMGFSPESDAPESPAGPGGPDSRSA